jgi:hypothetical protein
MWEKIRVGGPSRSARRVSSISVLVAVFGCSDAGFVEGDESPGEVVATSTEAITVQELFPAGLNGSLDGRLVTTPCGDNNPGGTDCVNGGAWYRAQRTACSNGQLNVDHIFPVAGLPGAQFSVKFRFFGIVEPKRYGAFVTRDAGLGRPGNQNSGAVPSPFASAPGGHQIPVSDYSTYEFRVRNTEGVEVAAYYLNADTQEGHWTYVLNFERDITVIGGGSVRVRMRDRNCRQIKNCGPMGTPATQCETLANARFIQAAYGANPAPSGLPAYFGGLLQPPLIPERPAGSSGQWLLIDAVRVN